MHNNEWQEALDRAAQAGMQASADLLASEQQLDALKASVNQLPPGVDPQIRMLLETGVQQAQLNNTHSAQFIALNDLLMSMGDALRALNQRVQRLEQS